MGSGHDVGEDFPDGGAGFPVELPDGAVLSDKGQTVALFIGGHGAADDAVGIVNVLSLYKPHGGTMDFLGEWSALLKFQILNFTVAVIHVADPEHCAPVADHAGLAVGKGDSDVHAGSRQGIFLCFGPIAPRRDGGPEREPPR